MRIEAKGSTEEAVQRLQDAYDKGYIVVTSDVLIDIARQNVRQAAQSLDPAALRRNLDPEGLHTAKQLMLHNDRDWRLEVLMKPKDAEGPVTGYQDVTMEQWERLRTLFAGAIARMRTEVE